MYIVYIDIDIETYKYICMYLYVALSEGGSRGNIES